MSCSQHSHQACYACRRCLRCGANCVDEPGPAKEFDDSPRDADHQRTEVVTLATEIGNHCLYVNLLRAAQQAGIAKRVDKNMWVYVDFCPQLVMLVTSLTCPNSNNNTYTFEQLSNVLCWDVPAGIAVFNLSRQRSLVCRPGRTADSQEIFSALSWTRKANGLGVLIIPSGLGLPPYAYVQVLYSALQCRSGSRGSFQHMFSQMRSCTNFESNSFPALATQT